MEIREGDNTQKGLMSFPGIASTIIWIILIVILVIVLFILLDRYVLFVYDSSSSSIDLDSDNMEYNLDPGRIISILNGKG